MSSKTHKKIVVYSHDNHGSGNIRRLLIIAKHLVANDPNTSILIVSGSPMLNAFRLMQGVDYIKLPGIRQHPQGVHADKSRLADYRAMLKLRSNIILSTLLDFDPDLVLVDKKPLGVGDELVSVLDLMRRRGHRAKWVLLLRDVLDNPETGIPLWERHGYYDAIESFYDQVLVAGDPEIFDPRREYRFSQLARDKVRFCGYVGREPRTRDRAQWREQFNIRADQPLVLVTPGCDEDGEQMLNTYLQGLQAVENRPAAHTFLVCGPEMAASRRQQVLATTSRMPDLTVRETVDDMLSCMDAADLVVCSGGYNTICEILSAGKRAIVVPRENPAQERWIRAERLAQLGLMRALHPSRLSPAKLMEILHEELAAPPNHNSRPYPVNLSGLSNIADALGTLLATAKGGFPAMGSLIAAPATAH